MSDTFAFDVNTLPNLDLSAPPGGFDWGQLGDLPAVSSIPDFSFSMPGGLTFANLFGTGGGAPLLPPVLNLPSTGNTGLTGFIQDAANLATAIYRGEAQVAAAQSAGRVANAQTAQLIAQARNPLNPWLILGLVGVGFLALRGSHDGGPPVQSIVSTTRRNR